MQVFGTFLFLLIILLHLLPQTLDIILNSFEIILLRFVLIHVPVLVLRVLFYELVNALNDLIIRAQLFHVIECVIFTLTTIAANGSCTCGTKINFAEILQLIILGPQIPDLLPELSVLLPHRLELLLRFGVLTLHRTH